MGILYGYTAVDWGSFVREIFADYFVREVQNIRVVEIDESKFRRRTKCHRRAAIGINMWVVGLVESHTNRVILYPVETRDAKTLESIIRKHVVPGTKIFADRWAAYDNLNRLGYNHFSVPHKIGRAS